MPKGAPKQRLIQAFGHVMGATSPYTIQYVSLARSTKKKGGILIERRRDSFGALWYRFDRYCFDDSN